MTALITCGSWLQATAPGVCTLHGMAKRWKSCDICRTDYKYAKGEGLGDRKMKYIGMPAGMWMIFKKSFRNALADDLGYDYSDANRITKSAKPKYRKIIEKLPGFEKEDRFKTNIINCALLTAFLLNMDRRPSVEEATRYYEHAMTNKATKIFCRMGGKKKFTDSDIEGMKKTAALRAGDRNPYSWNMDSMIWFLRCVIWTIQ